MMKKHPSAAPFMNLSVNPDYAQVVRDPLDLTLLEKRLIAGNYTTFEEFIAACRSIWSNAKSFTRTEAALYNASLEMDAYFEDIVAKLQHTAKGSRGNKGGSKAGGRKGNLERPLSSKEKTLLKQNIMRLSPDFIQGVATIITTAVGQTKNKETLEFDIDKLPISVARELDQYVKDHIVDTKKPLKKKKETPNVDVTLFLTS